MKYPSIKITLCTLGMVLVLGGCDSQNADEGAPPELISHEAFALQTDLFSPSGGKTLSKVHFTSAALRVWPVSVILQAHLVVPVVVTGAALQDTPELVDGTWIWSKTSEVGAETVSFTLRGRALEDGVDWSMRISSSGPIHGQEYDEFELYTAHTAPGGVAGSWQLFYRIDGERRNVLNADFALTSSDDKEITFRVPETADEHAGDWVRYEADGDARRFLWQQVEPMLVHDVAWDSSSKTGSIVATNHNEGEPGCWDGNRDDVACGD